MFGWKVTPLFTRYGRRWNLVGHYLVGGLLCMATAAVPLGKFSYEWPVVVLAMTGKYVSQVCELRFEKNICIMSCDN